MEEKEKEYKRFTVSVPEKLYEDFEQFRMKKEMSRSDCIRKAMTAYMINEENIHSLSGDVVGCITMIMSHEHFDPTHKHPHEHDNEITQDHGHIQDTEHPHEHDFFQGNQHLNHCTSLLCCKFVPHNDYSERRSSMPLHLHCWTQKNIWLFF